MASEQIKDTDRPFHVRTVPDNVFHSGYETEARANAVADQLTAKANDMGLTVTYKVVPLSK
jgi:hypothetical protein